MIKIITIGSATVDLFFQDDDLPENEDGTRLSLAYGGKYTAQHFVQSIGGGGGNCAVSLRRQGFTVHYWGKVGQGWAGQEIIEQLEREGVNTALIDHSSPTTTISAILLGRKRERTIVNYRAQNDLLEFTDQVQEVIKSCQWLYFANLSLCPKEVKIKWLQFAKDHGVKVLGTLSGAEFKKGQAYLKDFFALSDIFTANAHELADIWGGNAPDLDLNKENYARKLNLPLLIVTYDIHGSYTYTPEKIYYQPVIETKKKEDTTGAGDAYCSGFLGKFIKTGNVQQSMEFAAKNATSVIEHISAQTGLLFDP